MRARAVLSAFTFCLAGCVGPEVERDGGPLDAAVHDAAVRDAAVRDAAVRDADQALDGGDDGGLGACPVTLPSPLAFSLDHGAFPGSDHPDVAVHVPAGFDACAPRGAIVYFHGFNNCVLNAIGSTPGPCTPGGPTRSAHHLVEQLDEAGVNAMLIAVELRYDMATGAAGALGDAGGLRALLDELFDVHLSAMLGRPTRADELEHVVLASHSGGYTALARGLDRGGLPNVRGVMLFDSLYGEIPTFEAFTSGQLDRFDPALPAPLRFALVFTDGGGTATNSRALGAALATALSPTHPERLLFDDTTATLDAAAFAHPLIVKRSKLSHDGVVTYYFQRFVAAEGFAPR